MEDINIKPTKANGGIYKASKLSSNTPFHIVEAYKAVRTNILFSLAASKNKVTIVSSALPNEGKSVTCSNLAIAMSQTGSKVLLIDADLRKPTQHKVFRVDNSKGLSRLLVGFDSFEDTVKRNVERNLDLIPSGPQPPIPSELLGSQNMVNFLDSISDQYNFIFIDTPPVNVVTDAVILSRKAAGILVVARQKQTTYDELQKAIKSIQFAKANILGIIITDLKNQYNTKRSYKYYSYGYGDKDRS